MIEVQENPLDTYSRYFERLEKPSLHPSGTVLRDVRRSAFARFEELGFPTRRQEEWRYTSVAPIARTPFVPAGQGAEDLAREALPDSVSEGLVSSRLVFVDGHLSQDLSSQCTVPEGVRVGSLSTALTCDPKLVKRHLAHHAGFENRAFTALNTAFIEDGAFIYLPRRVQLEEPIELVYVSTGSRKNALTNPRNLIVLEEESGVTVIERYLGCGSGKYFTNAVTEIIQGDNTRVDFFKLQQESQNAFHIAAQQIYQGRDSAFSSHYVSLGGGLVRNDFNVLLDGEGVQCTLNGLYVIDGNQHEDNHTLIEHAKPHCQSHELYKGILGGNATGVFNGKIIVRKDAQKTDARQTNKNLLLSEDAAINTNPQLEIFADDVKCTHGATIGQLDKDAVFYLRTRGIAETDARKLLTHAFAQEITQGIRLQPLRAQLEGIVLKRLER